MTLGLTKTYTPSIGDFTVVAGYNTDVAALFNAFSGIEAQTSIPKGLTITPISNAIKTFNVEDVNTSSIFSVDTTNGLPMYKTSSVMAQNTGNDTLSVDVSIASGARVGVGSGSGCSITILKPSTKVLINVRTNWVGVGNCTHIDMSILRYVGGNYQDEQPLGRFYIAGSVQPVNATIVYKTTNPIKVVPTGENTFFLVAAPNGTTGSAILAIASSPQLYTYSFFVIEI